MHAWHSTTRSLKVDRYTKTIKAMHVYDSVVVLENGRVEHPRVVQRGEPSFQPTPGIVMKKLAGRYR